MAAHGKIQALNHAIQQALPGMVSVARNNPEARLLVRAIAFSDEAYWHVRNPTPVDELQWRDLEARGLTSMGHALELLAAALQSPPMEQRALPPVLVLISDGQPTDDFGASLHRLMSLPWAQRAVRISIAIGHEADLDVLQRFIGSPAPGSEGSVASRPLQASHANALAEYIEWAATTVVGATSQPVTRLSIDDQFIASPLPEMPPTIVADQGSDPDTVLW